MVIIFFTFRNHFHYGDFHRFAGTQKYPTVSNATYLSSLRSFLIETASPNVEPNTPKKTPEMGDKMKKTRTCTRGRNVVTIGSISWWSKSFKSWWEVLSGFNTWTMAYPLCNSCRWNRDQANRTLDSQNKRPHINKKQNKHPHINKKHGMAVKMENLKCKRVKPEQFPSSKSGLASIKFSYVPRFLYKSSPLW